MNPLTAIEKWISEHGSAASLRDHLALVKEQMAAVEKQKVACETAKSELESKVNHLEAENKNLRAKIDEYEKPHEPRAYIVPPYRPPSTL